MDWFKNKMIFYFGITDERYRFLNEWFNSSITKPAGVNMALGVNLDILELLYDFLHDKSTVSSTFSQQYDVWRLIISTKLVSGYNAVITLDSLKRNKISFKIWKGFDNGINSKAFSLEVTGKTKDDYEILIDKVSTAINSLEVEDSYSRKKEILEINEELKKLNNMEQREGYGIGSDLDLDMSVEFYTCYLPTKDINSIQDIALDVEELLDSKLIMLNDIELEEVMDNNIELFSETNVTNSISQIIFQLRILDVVMDYLMVKELKLKD